MDVHPTKNVSIGIDPYPFGSKTFQQFPMSSVVFTVFTLQRSLQRFPLRVSWRPYGRWGDPASLGREAQNLRKEHKGTQWRKAKDEN